MADGSGIWNNISASGSGYQHNGYNFYNTFNYGGPSGGAGGPPQQSQQLSPQQAPAQGTLKLRTIRANS